MALRAYSHGRDRVRDAWKRLLGEYLQYPEGLEPGFARRIAGFGARTFLELGGGNGPISKLLAPHGVQCVVVDRAPTVWEGMFRPVVTADLRAVPVRSASFDAASAVNCLYFLEDPRHGIRQAFDALRPGGLFLASAPSRYHDVELRDVDPRWGERSPFDAEEAPEHVASVFGADAIDVVEWEFPECYRLETHAAVVDYLVAFQVPDADERAALVNPPIRVTKKGTDVWAVKP